MSVEIISRQRGKRVSIERLKGKAERILEFLGQQKGELSIALVGNREIQELNSRYRGKNRPTDVLSFPPGGKLPPTIRLLGDVVISVEQAKRQARERNRSLEEELERLLIHGILHLLGYDHERSRREAKIMRAMEEKIERALSD